MRLWRIILRFLFFTIRRWRFRFLQISKGTFLFQRFCFVKFWGWTRPIYLFQVDSYFFINLGTHQMLSLAPIFFKYWIIITNHVIKVLISFLHLLTSLLDKCRNLILVIVIVNSLNSSLWTTSYELLLINNVIV